MSADTYLQLAWVLAAVLTIVFAIAVLLFIVYFIVALWQAIKGQAAGKYDDMQGPMRPTRTAPIYSSPPQGSAGNSEASKGRNEHQ